jgi:hypothetical protein
MFCGMQYDVGRFKETVAKCAASLAQRDITLITANRFLFSGCAESAI